jgi:hypothetical protein
VITNNIPALQPFQYPIIERIENIKKQIQELEK